MQSMVGRNRFGMALEVTDLGGMHANAVSGKTSL